MSPPSSTAADKLLVLEEAAEVSRREVVTGTVRVSTRTEIRQEVAEISLDHNVIDVTACRFAGSWT